MSPELVNHKKKIGKANRGSKRLKVLLSTGRAKFVWSIKAYKNILINDPNAVIIMR